MQISGPSVLQNLMICPLVVFQLCQCHAQQSGALSDATVDPSCVRTWMFPPEGLRCPMTMRGGGHHQGGPSSMGHLSNKKTYHLSDAFSPADTSILNTCICSLGRGPRPWRASHPGLCDLTCGTIFVSALFASTATFSGAVIWENGGSGHGCIRRLCVLTKI